MNHQQQTYNNCGPTSVAILLGYFDHWITQQKVNEVLPPGPRPCDTVAYVEGYGLKAGIYFMPGARKHEPIRKLLANDIPVIVDQRLAVDSDIGHYRVIHGYDDAAETFTSDDPLLGADLIITYGDFARLSRPGRRFFIPVYPPDKETLVQALMAESGLTRVEHVNTPNCKSQGQ